jgi:hypothetical protein
MNGSIYGQGLYSAGVYSWYVTWTVIACEEPWDRQEYAPPPAADWAVSACQPAVDRAYYVPMSTAEWKTASCPPLIERGL